jgi:hypothetical protein
MCKELNNSFVDLTTVYCLERVCRCIYTIFNLEDSSAFYK